MTLRAASFRGASLGPSLRSGRGWRTSFGAPLLGSAIALALVALVVLGLVRSARSDGNRRETPTAQAVVPSEELANPSTDRLEESLRDLERTQIGTSTLSDEEISRLMARAEQNRPPRLVKADPGPGSTSASSSSGTGSSGGDSGGGGSSGGGSGGGDSSGGSGGGGSGGSNGGGSDGDEGSGEGGPGGGGPGGG